MKYVVSALMIVAVCLVGTRVAADEKQADELEGVWQVASFTEAGEKGSEDEAKKYKVSFSKEKFTVTKEGKVIQEGTYKADPTKKPKAVDFTFVKGGASEGKVALGIFTIDGDELKICFSEPATERPAEEKRPREFTSTATSKTALNVYKREKK